MKTFTKPVFILLFVTLPQLVFFTYLCLDGGGTTGSSALSGAVTLLLMGIFTIYALTRRSQDSTDTGIFIAISAAYALYIAAMLLYCETLDNLTGSISPRLIFIILAMIPVLYGIFGTVLNSTADEKGAGAPFYGAGLIAVPLLWYTSMSLFNGTNLNAMLMIFIIAGLYTMMMLTMKTLLAWQQKNHGYELIHPSSPRYYIITVLVMLLLPLGGLTINQNFWTSDASGGMFGDFSSSVFFTIAVLNGLFMLLPPVEDKNLRLLVFYLKAVGYTYILYFFIVFIPILPLGAIGLIFYGLGIFIFAPTLAAIWQGAHLIKEWAVLTSAWGRPRILAVFCAGIITLPLGLISVFWGDGDNFEAAVQYLDKNNMGTIEAVDMTRLERTLRNIKGSHDLRTDMAGFNSESTPIISALYANLVLDGKVISQHNILTLENMFLDSGHILNEISGTNSDTENNVQLRAVDSQTEFDQELGVYRSWIDLTLDNAAGVDNEEYVTSFKLPEGAYVSDYYLDVSGHRKEGILTEQQSALSIYRKILNIRRDPGLLRYTARNTLELRVFPFNRLQIRQTGFEILHNYPFILNLDDKTISLGDKDANVPQEITIKGVTLVTPEQKAALKQVKRNPEYYFVIDCSESSDITWHTEQIEAYAKAHNITRAEVLFTSYKAESHSLADMKQIEITAECGFNLDRAVRMILSRQSDERYPLIIVVSDNMPGAVFPENIYPLSDRFPESPYYYALNHDMTLTPYSFDSNQSGKRIKDPILEPILDFNGMYVSDNDKLELVLSNREIDKLVLTGNRYKDAVLLNAAQQGYLLNGKLNSRELIRASFRARILTPQTAFIVVETAEQEKELLDLQEKVLNSNEQTPTITLNEPPLLIGIIFLLALIIFKSKSCFRSRYKAYGKKLNY